jgi:hypothetical protein
MKLSLLGLTAMMLLANLPAANAAVYVGWSSKGAPIFTFKSSTPATPGDTQEVTLSRFYRNVSLSGADACGYKSISAGTSATGIADFTMGGTVTNTSTLPVFDGTCNSGTLTPKVSGASVPTSHYMTPDGKLNIKVGTNTLAQVALTGQKRTLKADACGNYKLSWPAAKTGEPAFAWDASVTVSGTSYDLEDATQTATEGLCSSRWSLVGLVPTKVAKFFVQQ